MSQEEVALEAEITTSYYGLVERGVKSPTVRMLEKICRALDYPISELFSANVTRETEDNKYIYQIVNLLKNRSAEECEQIYQIVKTIILFKDEDN